MEPEPLHWAVGVFATGPPGKSPQPFYFTHSFKALDFPGDSDGKEFACITGDPGLISRWGRFAREGNGYPLQYSCLENSVDIGSGQAMSLGKQRIRHH